MLGIKSADNAESSRPEASMPIPGAPRMSTVSLDRSHDTECIGEGGSHAIAVAAGAHAGDGNRADR